MTTPIGADISLLGTDGINSFPLSGGAQGSYFYFFNTCRYILRYPPCGEGAPASLLSFREIYSITRDREIFY